MTMTFAWAFTILLAMWFIGGILGKKTGGVMGASLFSTLALLICFWLNILPPDIVKTAELQTFNKLVTLVLAINIVSSVNPQQLKNDWRLVVVVLVSILGAAIGVFGVCGLLYDMHMLTAVFPVLVGGIVAANTIITTASAKELHEIAAVCTLFFSLHSLIGLPLISIGTKHESQRLLKQFWKEGKASALTKKSAAVKDTIPNEGKTDKKPFYDRLPKQYQSSLYPLLLAVLIGAVSDSIGSVLNKPTMGIFGMTTITLILGFIAVQFGFLQKSPLQKAGVNDFFMFVAVVSLRASLGQLSFQRVLDYLPMLVCVFAAATFGIMIFGYLSGKLLGYSFHMVMAFCFGCFAGYPLNYSAAMDAVSALVKNKEEQAMLETEVVSRVILGGVVGVTILSTILANFCAVML